MASSYVNDLRLNEMATGDASGTWGTTTNTNLELIGEALGYGTEGITTNADTHTSTIADGATDPVRAMYVEYTGTLDSACTITIAPNTVNRMQFIENGTSGSQNIIIKQGSGATITIPPGDVKAVYLDGAGSGAAVVDAFASLNVVDLKVQDDLTVTDDATIGGTLGVTGIVTLTDDLIIGDGKTIGSASDVDAMTIAANGQITLTQTLIGTALDISGDIDVDGTTNLDNTDIDGTLDVSGQVTFADGSAGAPSISNTGDVNAGLFFSAADVMSFSAGGTAQFTMADGSISPVTDNDIDLGTASLKYKSFFAGLVDAENFKINGAQGSDGQVLTSTGSGVAFEDASGGVTFKEGGTNFTNSIMVGDSVTGTLSSATGNTALGVDVFADLTSGDNNVAVGYRALASNTTASNNIAIGASALLANTTGNTNTAVGVNALTGNTSGIDNVAVGKNALSSNTTGNYGVGIGALALQANTTGQNVAIGQAAMISNTTGTGNVAIGTYDDAGLQPLKSNTTGDHHVAIGTGALAANTTADENTGVGYKALALNTTGTLNASLGRTAGAACTTGSNNTFIGANAGDGATTASNNTFIGKNAGSNATTSGANTLLGQGTTISSATDQGSQVVLGQGLTGIGYHQGILGGINAVYNQGNSTAWQQTSDIRIKKNIEDYTVGLDAINGIRTRTFDYRRLDEIPNGTDGEILNPNELPEGQRIGVIAQEIIDVLPSCVKEHPNSRLSVTTDNILWTLINAVQELSAEVEKLKLQLGD